MTPEQISTFSLHIGANADSEIVIARNPATRHDKVVLDWYNAASTTDAWLKQCTGWHLWDAMNFAQYDSITKASYRELWLEMMRRFDERPDDMGKNNLRNSIAEIWSTLNAAQKTTLFTKLTEKARRVELAFPSTSKITESVTAIDRSFFGQCSSEDVGRALNLLNGN